MQLARFTGAHTPTEVLAADDDDRQPLAPCLTPAMPVQARPMADAALPACKGRVGTECSYMITATLHSVVCLSSMEAHAGRCAGCVVDGAPLLPPMQANSPAQSNIHNSTVWKTRRQQVPAARAVHSTAPIRVREPAAWHTLNTEPINHSASSQVLGLQHVHASGQPPMRMCGSIQHAVMTCRRPAHQPIPSRTPSRHALMDACMHVDWQSSINAHCLQRAWHYVAARCHGPWVMQPRPHTASRAHGRD